MVRLRFQKKDGNMYLRELVTCKETMGSKNHVSSGVYDGVPEFSDGQAIVYRKGPWTTEEDALLVKYVKNMGERNWKNVQKTGLMRCGKSCRLRWTNHLKPDLKKGAFSAEEERIVIQLHHRIGNRWSIIASKLPGRTDNEVKNFWNTKIKRRVVIPSPESLEETSSSKQENTFSLINPNYNSSMEPPINRLTCSTIHEDSMISFTNKSSYKLEFLVEEEHPSLINNPNANTFPLTNTNVSSCFYTQQNLSEHVKNNSLSFESEITMEVQEKEVTSIWTRTENDSNYCYLGSSKMEVTSEEKSLEEEMESIEDELSNLLNTFTSDEPRLELDLKTGGDNTMPTYHHFYLDQKVVFPSFSEDMIPTTSDSNTPGSISSEIVECFNEEDWINTPEST